MWTAAARIACAVCIGTTFSAAIAAGQAGAGAGGRTPAPAERILGLWRLVSFENIDEQGRRTPGGYDEGRIMYDAQGHMSAQLMRAKRPPHAPTPTEAERAASYGTYVAYYGRYDLDAAAARVTHHVEGALNPNWVGTDLVRYWEFSPDGSRLSLSIRNAQGRTTGTLVWEKMH